MEKEKEDEKGKGKGKKEKATRLERRTRVSLASGRRLLWRVARREKGRRKRSQKARIRQKERIRKKGERKKNGELVTPGSPRLGLDNRDVFRAKNRPGTRVSALACTLAGSRLVESIGCWLARLRALSLSQLRCSRPRGSERRSPAIFRPRKRSGVGVSLDTSFDALLTRRHGHLRAAREQVSQLRLQLHPWVLSVYVSLQGLSRSAQTAYTTVQKS